MHEESVKQDGVSTAEVARRAGVHRDTLLRWLRRGLLPEPGRDRNGWRSFSEAEARAVINFAMSPGDTPAMPLIAREPEPRRYGYGKPLDAIDWDFQGAKTNYSTHRIHPYPAKFIPQIPNALIQELSSVGDTIGDIFCGSGTTIVEALTLKRHAVGIDANPLACLISSTKTTVIGEAESDALRALAAKSRELGDSILSSTSDGDLFPSERFISTAWRPAFEKLPFWFENHVIEELAEVMRWCRELQGEAARNLALTAFSSIVVAVSRQDSDTRYVRREKNILQGETMRRFARTLEQATVAAIEFSDMVEPRFKRQIIEANLLEAPKIPMLDLVVCSPPYPNAYSYHLYHMTRMIWLGMNQPKFKREEIGSHRKYSSPGKNGATADTFRSEFTAIFGWLASYIKYGGHACFVVGNSTLKGETFNNADILSEASRAAGFRETMRINRTMQSTKKSFNPAIGKIKQEQILILENTGGTR
jgi:site-specific DNA-methyltransferase (cytosine-N4-specific)